MAITQNHHMVHSFLFIHVIHSSGLTVFGFFHIEVITLGAGEEVAGRASGTGVG